MNTQHYDVVVIGAGSGGLTSAVGFSKIGKKVLLIEREHIGGECTNSGCIPSKALLHHAKAYWHAKTVAGTTEQSEAYRNEAFTYVRGIIDSILEDETPATFEAMGIDVVMGEAVFQDSCAVAVGDTRYHYKTAIIATGSAPRLVEIPGLDQAHLLTNQNIFKLDSIPATTLIIGAGPIGLEMGQALAMLGSQVTIAAIEDIFLRLEDPAISPYIRKQFEAMGITIELNAFIKEVAGQEAIFERKESDVVTDTFTVPFEKVLIAIGRVPNIPEGTKAAGITTSKYGVEVDSQYRTSNRYVYALGDVSQRLKFTHTADDTARQVVTRVASKGLFRVSDRKAVPKVTYTLPEIAQVGLSHSAAIAKYGEDRILRLEVPFSESDRAKTDGTTDGVAIVIVRRVSGTILGAHIAGPTAGEIIALFTMAIDQKISMWKLRNQIYAYPSYSLIIKKIGDQFFATQIYNLRTDIVGILKRNAPKLIAAIFWLALIIGFHQYRIDNNLSYTDVLFGLITFFTTTAWGPVIYMVLYAVRPIILFPATLLTALSGALFGLWWGIFYTVLGENASANLAYWIGRFFGKGLKLEDSIIGNWVEALRKRPFGTVLFMRLFYVPFDLTNYGSGILKIKWSSYFTATLIGIMPGLTTFVALGAALDLESFRANGITFDAFEPAFLALSAVIFIVSLGLSKVLKRWHATSA